jgi:hypothetical protein
VELLTMKYVPLFRFLPAALCVAVPLFSGCMTVTDRIGALLEGKFDYAVNQYRSPPLVSAGQGYRVVERAGKSGQGLDIYIESFPAITVRATPPGADGTFYVRSLDYLGGNPLGWVEFRLDLAGEGKFVVRNGTATLRLKPPTEPLRISGGKIRRGDNHIAGADALTALNNRYERIIALSEWMRGRKVPEPAARNLRDFQSYWKAYLLPELVPAELRPKAYETGEATRWVTAEQVKWNATYTERTLPEELRPLRDSGTIKRDWEESSEWIFLVYAWDHIFNTLETTSVAVQKK